MAQKVLFLSVTCVPASRVLRSYPTVLEPSQASPRHPRPLLSPWPRPGPHTHPHQTSRQCCAPNCLTTCWPGNGPAWRRLHISKVPRLFHALVSGCHSEVPRVGHGESRVTCSPPLTAPPAAVPDACRRSRAPLTQGPRCVRVSALAVGTQDRIHKNT